MSMSVLTKIEVQVCVCVCVHVCVRALRDTDFIMEGGNCQQTDGRNGL